MHSTKCTRAYTHFYATYLLHIFLVTYNKICFKYLQFGLIAFFYNNSTGSILSKIISPVLSENIMTFSTKIYISQKT